MPIKPHSRASARPYTFRVARGLFVVTFWWRGRWRGIGLPTWERTRVCNGVYQIVSRGGRSMPAKPVVAEAGKSGASHGSWKAGLSNVASWLCDAAYPDGELMGAVQLQLKREGTIIRATLKIADQNGLKVSAIGESPSDALLALDLVLESAQCPWEKDAFPLASKQGKKK